MSQKKILTILSVVLLSSAYAQDSAPKKHSRRGEAAGYSSRDATVLSVMGWGTGLAVGIATLSALLNNESTSGHNH